jgi:tetratricopeptide (TPR) repeat protein
MVFHVVSAAWLLASAALPALAESTATTDSASVAPAETAAPPSPPPVATTPVTEHSARTAAVGAPSGLGDITEWLAFRSRNHLAALPEEARIFYRRGLLIHQSGSTEEAIRLVRGSGELDPNFIAPHLSLASWFLFQDPSQALLQLAAIVELLRDGFPIQLGLVANGFVLGIQALFLGLLAAALLLIWVHNAELRHALSERLAPTVSVRSAKLWAWSAVVLPFALGFGVTLPTLMLLGLLWPTLKRRERGVLVALVALLCAAPWIGGVLDRLSIPLRPDHGPFYEVPTLASEPWSAERQQSVVALADAHPDNAFLQFGLGWEARRGGDLATAERAYRRALALWPANDRLITNLGNTLAMQGRSDDALALYQRASTINPHNAAAFYNASQIYTQRFEYRGATDALTRASALDFELVKRYQSQGTSDGLLLLIDEWLGPRTFWEALITQPVGSASSGVLPPGWRTRLECRGWAFTAAAVALAVAAALAGWLLNRGMPLRSCSNCGAVLCRRCAQRRRENALCAACAAVDARAESADFSGVILADRRRSITQRRGMMRSAVAALIPGYGLLAMGRIFPALGLLVASAALLAPELGLGAPFSFEPRLNLASHDLPVGILVACWISVYALSLLGYFSSLARLRAATEPPAPARGRNLSAPTRRTEATAA